MFHLFAKISTERRTCLVSTTLRIFTFGLGTFGSAAAAETRPILTFRSPCLGTLDHTRAHWNTVEHKLNIYLYSSMISEVLFPSYEIWNIFVLENVQHLSSKVDFWGVHCRQGRVFRLWGGKVNKRTNWGRKCSCGWRRESARPAFTFVILRLPCLPDQFLGTL